MVCVVAYCTEPKESVSLKERLTLLLRERQKELRYREFINDRAGFLQYVKGNPYLIMLIVQRDGTGRETARLAREANSKARLLWFSSHNCALEAFEIHATYFGMLSVSREKLEEALDSCGLSLSD